MAEQKNADKKSSASEDSPRSLLEDFSLAGKGALVVGAEHAVGRAAAVTLAEAGANVVLASQEPGTDKQLKEGAKLVPAAGAKAGIRMQEAATRPDPHPTPP